MGSAFFLFGNPFSGGAYFGGTPFLGGSPPGGPEGVFQCLAAFAAYANGLSKTLVVYVRDKAPGEATQTTSHAHRSSVVPGVSYLEGPSAGSFASSRELGRRITRVSSESKDCVVSSSSAGSAVSSPSVSGKPKKSRTRLTSSRPRTARETFSSSSTRAASRSFRAFLISSSRERN